MDDYATLIDFLSTETNVDKNIFKQEFCIEFIKELTGLSVQDLEEKERKLVKEAADIETANFEILSMNYKLFLDSNRYLWDLSDTFNMLLPGLEDTSGWPDKIIEQFEICETSRKKKLDVRSDLQLLAKELDHLEPLLEIPTLFDTLLRNGHHEEAMDLQLFTQRLPVRYPNIPYLEKLASIEANSQAMLVQLLSMLRGPVKLPVSMRVIGYLRRLKYSEAALQILFLTLRNEYLCGLLSIVKETQPHEYIRRWVETQREHLFDILTHYKHIFPDSKTSTQVETQIISSFALLSVTNLLNVLREFLNVSADISFYPSVCTQIMYYGMTMGRIGMDFRALVVTMFESSVERIITDMIQQASNFFSLSMAIERPSLNSSNEDLLMKSVAVAILYNQYMNAFNQLRYMPCLSLYQSLSECLVKSVQNVVDKVLAAHSTNSRQAELAAWIISEALLKPVFDAFDRVMATDVIDYSDFNRQLAPLVEKAKMHASSLNLNGVEKDEASNKELPELVNK